MLLSGIFRKWCFWLPSLNTPWPPPVHSWTHPHGGFPGSAVRCWAAALHGTGSSLLCTGSMAARPLWSGAQGRTQCWLGSACPHLSLSWSAARAHCSSSAVLPMWMNRWKGLNGCSCVPMACKCPGVPLGYWHRASGTGARGSRHRHWPPCKPPPKGRCKGSWAAQSTLDGGTSGGTHSCSWATSRSYPHL